MAQQSPKTPDQRVQSLGTIPESLNTPEFLAAWAQWCRHTTDSGLALTPTTAARQLDLLAKLGPQAAIADIHKTMQAHKLNGSAPHPQPMASAAAHAKKETAKKEQAKKEAAKPRKPAGKGKKSKVEANPKVPAEDSAGADTAPTMPAQENAKAPEAPEAPAAANLPVLSETVPAMPMSAQRRSKKDATKHAENALGGNATGGNEAKSAKMSALDAAAKVLAESGQAMTCQELITAMSAKGYWTSPGGKTPQATLYSAILREMGSKGATARFRKSERGKFVSTGK